MKYFVKYFRKLTTFISKKGKYLKSVSKPVKGRCPLS